MGCRIDPRNVALADQVAAALRDAHPGPLTAREIVDKIGGARTMWRECDGGRYCHAHGDAWAGNPYVSNSRHHPDGWDIWERRLWPPDVYPLLTRMVRDGLVFKVRHPSMPSVLWTWRGPNEDSTTALEAIWEASS